MLQILLVEDDLTLSSLIAQNLRAEGYAVQEVSSGEKALSHIENAPPNLMILDVGLPDMEGFEVLRQLREKQSLPPTIMLTARGGEKDRVTGLDLGADDYLAKPFSLQELMARIQAVSRRARPAKIKSILSGPFELDRTHQQVHFHPKGSEFTQTLHLTEIEYQLLEYLMLHAGTFCTPHALLKHVWGNPPTANRRTLSVHMANLRKKLTMAGEEGPIKTSSRLQGSTYAWALPIEG